MPRWIRIAVFERDGGRCSFRDRHGAICGRTTELFVEDRPWAPSSDRWDPRDYKLTCLYHLEDGAGFDEINWRTAARA